MGGQEKRLERKLNPLNEKKEMKRTAQRTGRAKRQSIGHFFLLHHSYTNCGLAFTCLTSPPRHKYDIWNAFHSPITPDRGRVVLLRTLVSMLQVLLMVCLCVWVSWDG
jgi:hypothetical protein